MSSPRTASEEDQKRAASHPPESPATPGPDMGIPAFTSGSRVTQAQHGVSVGRSRSRSSSQSSAKMEVNAGRLAKKPRLEGDSLEARWEEERRTEQIRRQGTTREGQEHLLQPLQGESKLEVEIRQTSVTTEEQHPLTTRSALRGYGMSSLTPVEESYQTSSGGNAPGSEPYMVTEPDERRLRLSGSSTDVGSRDTQYKRDRREYPIAYHPGTRADNRPPTDYMPVAGGLYSSVPSPAVGSRSRQLPPPVAGGWSSEHPASIDPRIQRRGTFGASSGHGVPGRASQSSLFSEQREAAHSSSSALRRLSSPHLQSQSKLPVAGSSSAIQASQHGSPAMGVDVDEKRGEGSVTTTSSGKTQAVFVSKLYTMLEDSSISQAGLLRWSDDGMGFICPNPAEFARTILPQFFKHNNWHSFVRQLNMYGFNKVNDVFQNLSAAPDAPVPWEFRHTIFRRGDPDAISRIKRRSVKSNNAAREQQASTAAAAAHAASLSRGEAPPSTERRFEYGHHPRYSTSAIPLPQARSAPYPPAQAYLRRPMAPPAPSVEWRDESDREHSEAAIHPSPHGEVRAIHQVVPTHMRPPSQGGRRSTEVSPLQTQGAFEYGPYPTARRYTPTPEGRSGHERPISRIGRPTSSGNLGVRIHDIVRDSEELCDKLTDVFSRVEGNRLHTTTLIDRLIDRFGERLNATELEETRIEWTRLQQAGIHAVQSVSTCLSDSSHLSQTLQVFVDDLVLRGVVSREDSQMSESVPSPEPAATTHIIPQREASPRMERTGSAEIEEEKERERQRRKSAASDDQSTERGGGNALRDLLN